MMRHRHDLVLDLELVATDGQRGIDLALQAGVQGAGEHALDETLVAVRDEAERGEDDDGV